MDLAKPSKIFDGGLIDLVRKMCVDKNINFRMVICTHRGNNVSAWMSTYNWLNNHDVLDKFDMIHSLDNRINKDKINFLKGAYPNSKIVLFDDNPHSRDLESVIIYNEINLYKKYEGLKIINSDNLENQLNYLITN